MKRRERNLTISAILAAGIGYAVGILTAPRSGRKTRRELQKTAVRSKKEAEKKLKQLHTELNELIEEGEKKGRSLKQTSQTELRKSLDKANDLKEKARSLLSAIHEGDAEDEDLQRAVKEVNKSIESLKKYLEKNATKK